MRPAIFMLFVAISAALGAWPGSAADYSRAVSLRAPASGPVLPFPRGERTARVWDARACWSACQSVCTADQAACLKAASEPQADCVAWTDRCDRDCQRECRSGAGPLLPID